MPRREVLACLLLALYTPASARTSHTGAAVTTVAVVTVVLDFKGPNSPKSIIEMEREASQIPGASGVQLSWRTRAEAAGADYSDLVVMTFRGNCKSDPAMPRYDESGPYAVTWTTDRRVMPFGEVDCQKVINAARSAM